LKITLIEPAPPGFHVYSFIRQVRLGLPLLGRLLSERGHDVRIFVESLAEVDWRRVAGSDLVGISTITSTAIKAYRYAERARRSGVPVVMGGPHVTFEAEEALEFADYVVRGEGEDTLLELVSFLEGRGGIEDIAGLSYRSADGVDRHNAARPLRESLSDLPLPDLSLITAHDKIKPTPFLTSRGCPHDCDFCSVIEMFGRRVRTVDPELVIQGIKKAGPQSIFFYDDNFLMSKRMAKDLLAKMIREDLGIPFSAQIRVDSVYKRGRVDRELLQLLVEAGCYLVYLGLESVNPETLAAYNKHQTVEDIAGGLAALHEHGIRSHGMFVFGSDTDTVESMAATADFAIEHQISSAQFMILTPLPGTAQFRRLDEQGRIFTRNWSLYDGHHAVFWPKQMDPWELQQASMEAHMRFYRLRRLPPNPKHRLMGFLISHGWEHVPDNMAYLRELRSFTEEKRTDAGPASRRRPAQAGPGRP
jgi:anaerobic magnesium-protoporphyrin IX monomethyl ester cyclase